MSRSLIVCLALVLGFTAVASAQLAHNPNWVISPNSPIPPSGSGGGVCGAVANTFDTSLFTPFVGTVGRPTVAINLDHTYSDDVVMTLIHNGIYVVISDGDNFAAGSGLDYAGQYNFVDTAGTTLDNAPVGPPGTLTPGTYKPDNPLSAFVGTSIAGVWTLRICDRYGADVGILHSFGISIETAGTQVSDPFVPQAIPPSGTGGTGCGTPASSFTHVLNVTASGKVGDVATYFNMTHTWSGDLLITLSHFGVTRVIFDGSGATGSNNFAGVYSFWENRFAPLTLADTGGGNVNTGYYQSQQNFVPFHGMEMSGPWALTICDQAGADVGVLSGFTLSIAREGFNLALQQPSASANIVAADSNGANIGNVYFNAFTLISGNYPYGWWYGIDIAYGDLLSQFNTPLPFFTGTLDGAVSATSFIAGPIPSGITVFGVAIEIENAALRQSSIPLVYTTIP
jgi:subtilisin-like proprotein convertase family protein